MPPCKSALSVALLLGSTLAIAQANHSHEQQHDGMPGMDHSRMDHGGMKHMHPGDGKEGNGVDVKAMDHGRTHGMDHGGTPKSSSMQGMDHGGVSHGDMKRAGSTQDTAPALGASQRMDAMPGMDHGDMKGMGSMQGGSPPPDARDPDAYSNGLALEMLPGMDMADNDRYGQLLVDQLEAYRENNGEAGIRLDAQAWYGTDLNKVWLKAEGSKVRGRLGATRTEALYNRAFAPYFGWQVGVRHDFGGGPGRNWAAFGIQGLAPYWFHVEATAYVGSSGRTALRLEGEYDLRITQRLVLQPDMELKIFGKSDPERGIGSGLTEADLGLRLRYEITRKFGPYIGVVWGRKLGSTADMARRAGEPVGESRIVAGVRLWF